MADPNGNPNAAEPLPPEPLSPEPLTTSNAEGIGDQPHHASVPPALPPMFVGDNASTHSLLPALPPGPDNDTANNSGTSFNLDVTCPTPSADSTLPPSIVDNSLSRWITDSTLSKIQKLRPSGDPTTHADENIAAFECIFTTGSEWTNQYELEGTLRLMASWYGFSTKCTGNKILCCFGMDYRRRKADQAKVTHIGDLTNQSISHLQYTTASLLDCPFYVRCSPIKNSGSNKSDTMVRLTASHFNHNHDLNMAFYLQGKKSSSQFRLSPAHCQELVSYLRNGDLHPRFIRKFVQERYHNIIKITPKMVCHLRCRIRKLEAKHGSCTNIPSKSLRNLFDENTFNEPLEVEYSPHNAKVVRDTLRDMMEGDDYDPSDPDSEPKVCGLLRNIQDSQDNGWDHEVVYQNGSVCGVIYQTEQMKHAFVRWGDLISIDAQKKHVNTFGWVFIAASGYNCDNQLESFVESLWIEEMNSAYEQICASCFNTHLDQHGVSRL